MDWEKIMGSILTVNLVALNFKIIWDWLKNRKGDDKPAGEKHHVYCPLHETHSHDIEEIKRCNMFLKQEASKHEVILTVRTTEIFKKLKTTADDLRDVKKTMASMDKSLAVLSAQAGLSGKNK